MPKFHFIKKNSLKMIIYVSNFPKKVIVMLCFERIEQRSCMRPFL